MNKTEKRREWFPVEMTIKEDLPGDKVPVFVTDGEYVDVGCFDFDDSLWITALGFVDPDHITHWMEIPSPGELASFFVPMNERKETPKEPVSVTGDKQKISYQEMYEFVARYMHQEDVSHLDFDRFYDSGGFVLNVSRNMPTHDNSTYYVTHGNIKIDYLLEDQDDSEIEFYPS